MVKAVIGALIFMFVFMFGLAQACAQTKTDTIEIRKRGLGYHYRISNTEISPRNLSMMLRSDPETAFYLKRAKTNGFWGSFFAGLGAGVIGGVLGESLTGNQVNVPLLVTGAASLGVGIALGSVASKYVAMAVRRYNYDFGKTAYRHIKPEYYLSFYGSGAGLVVRF